MITIVSTKQLPLGSEWEHIVTKRENSFYDYDGNYVPQLSYDIEVNVYHFTGAQCTIPEEVFNILEAEDAKIWIDNCPIFRYAVNYLGLDVMCDQKFGPCLSREEYVDFFDYFYNHL